MPIVKVIPKFIRIEDAHARVETSEKGFVRISGLVVEIDRERLEWRDANKAELMYEAFEKCAEAAKAMAAKEKVVKVRNDAKA
jgi:hypothetical protein